MRIGDLLAAETSIKFPRDVLWVYVCDATRHELEERLDIPRLYGSLTSTPWRGGITQRCATFP